MSLSQEIEQQWKQLLSGKDRGGPLGPLSADTPHGRLDCELLEIDALGCSLARLRLRTDRLDAAQAEDLRRLGTALGQRLRYLLEPIGVVELDGEAATLQMRSCPPQANEQGHTYYELTARRGELCLCRYHKPPGGPRQVIPATVTREVLARLAHDFDQALE